MQRLVYLLIVTSLGLPGSVSAQPNGSPLSDFRPDLASVQRYGTAYRYPQAGWIVLHIEGEPYERGYQHGRLLAPEIAGYLRCFAAQQGSKAPTEAWKLTRTLVNALFLRRFDKEYLEEMKGIADGATAAGARFDSRPIDLVDIVGINCWAEIATLDSGLAAVPTGLEGIRFPNAQPRAMPKPQEDHCSAFAATGPATADGKIVFGHITMFGLYPANFYNVWLDIKPAKGRRMLMCAFPGAIHSGMDYYMNDAGLLIAETTISQTRFDIHGQTEAARIRQAIQYADSIDKAVAILKKDNNGLYTNEWLLADINTNEIALFELGTHKSKLHRSSKNEWIGGTTGFYWGCNNTKDLEVRLETVASVKGRPVNVVFRPTDRDKAWQRLYHKHKGKIDVAFGKEAFTTPPLAAFPSLDAKFTTTALAKELKSWALFGPPLGRTWQPTQDERKRYPEIKPLVSNPWTILHAHPPPKEDTKLAGAVDLNVLGKEDAAKAKAKPLLDVPAWHGTLLPATDADIWLAAAFADYERIFAREKGLAKKNKGTLTAEDRDKIAVDCFAYRSSYLAAARAGGDVPLSRIKSDYASDTWYKIAAGKGVLLLHELRHTLGDAAFEKTMDAFGRDNAGKKVSSAQFQAHVEKATGKPLDKLFDSWLNQTGLPALKLEKVASTAMMDTDRKGIASIIRGYTVRGEIVQEGPRIEKIDVTVEAKEGDVTKTVTLNGSRTTFNIEIQGGSNVPGRVLLDKQGKVSRADGGVFSVLSFQSDQEHSLIIYGTADEVPTNREAAIALRKAIRERWSNVTVSIKSDKQVTEADLKSRHLLLIGRPDSNALVKRFKGKLPIAFGSRSFVVRGKTYAHPGSAVIVAAENPLNPSFGLVVIAGLSAEATLRTAPGLMRRDLHSAEVVLLPHGGTVQEMVLSTKDTNTKDAAMLTDKPAKR